MVEYCENFQNRIFENSRFSAWAQNSLRSSNKLLDVTEKDKTVIECYFLLPDFKSPGHPRLHAPLQVMSEEASFCNALITKILDFWFRNFEG